MRKVLVLFVCSVSVLASCGSSDPSAEGASPPTTAADPGSAPTEPQEATRSAAPDAAVEYFTAIADGDDAAPFAVPSSVAATYAAYMRAFVLAEPQTGDEQTVEVEDDGSITLRSLYSVNGQAPEVTTYSDLVVDEASGKLSSFSTAEGPMSFVGLGSIGSVCGVTVSVVAARENSTGLFIAYTIRNDTDSLLMYQGTTRYKNADGLTVESSRMYGQGDRLPRSLTYVVDTFENSEVGGSYRWTGAFDDQSCGDYGSITLDLPIG